jgi:arsenate reductase-like glutaredoxin family protein
MDSSRSRATVYTLPDCVKCDELKVWLEKKGEEYEMRSFTTEVQLEFIMKNMFGNPPILEMDERLASSEELFLNDLLKEEKVLEVLGHSKA